MEIQGITFDFWSTLFKDTGSIGKERQTWRLEEMAKGLRKSGWVGSTDAVAKAVEAASEQGTHIRLQGKDDFLPEQQLDFIFNYLEISPDKAVGSEVYEAYTVATGKFPPAPMPGMLDTVREVAKLCPVGLISNTGITPGSVLRQVLDGVGILDCFTTLTFSNEVNLVKPNPQIFELTAKNLRVEVQKTLHVGDDYEADVVGAAGVGAKGVWLKTGETDKPVSAFAVIQELPELLRLLGRHANG